jgi:hypothetical protein
MTFRSGSKKIDVMCEKSTSSVEWKLAVIHSVCIFFSYAKKEKTIIIARPQGAHKVKVSSLIASKRVGKLK